MLPNTAVTNDSLRLQFSVLSTQKFSGKKGRKHYAMEKWRKMDVLFFRRHYDIF